MIDFTIYTDPAGVKHKALTVQCPGSELPTVIYVDEQNLALIGTGRQDQAIVIKHHAENCESPEMDMLRHMALASAQDAASGEGVIAQLEADSKREDSDPA